MPAGRTQRNFLENLYWKIKTYRTDRSKIEIRNCAGSYRLAVPAGASFVEKYESTGEYEPMFESELKRRLTAFDTPVYYDIGSRWGYFTKFSSLITSPELVHGFDANPRWFSFLKQTHEQDLPGISLTNAYVSAESGDDAISIDDYRLEHSDPDVVKIDIEGSEYEALTGMRETLEDAHPVVFVEVHPSYLRNRGSSANAVFDFLRTLGYELRGTTNHRTGDQLWSPISDVNLPSNGDYLILAE